MIDMILHSDIRDFNISAPIVLLLSTKNFVLFNNMLIKKNILLQFLYLKFNYDNLINLLKNFKYVLV